MSSSGSIPVDFGGLLGVWVDSGHAVVIRIAQGRETSEGIQLTPLNLLQAEQLVAQLIAEGCSKGYITAEHMAQRERMPATNLADTMRSRVDDPPESPEGRA